MSSSVVGIDLGTTYSLAAYVDGGNPYVVRDSSGQALVPSVVSFHSDGSVLVGRAAKERALSDPGHTIFSIKRLMGRTLSDLQAELQFIPQQIVEREQDGRKILKVQIDQREYTPIELSALILREVCALAGNPTKAVITVPAYFDDTQRQATRDAGRIAGLDVLRIVNEPTAAALAYGLDRKQSGTIAVYDLGGGTFDCSILRIDGGVFKVLSTNGDTHLGGDDFDQALMNLMAQDLGVTMSRENPLLLQQLRAQGERAKIALSTALTATVTIGEYSRTITRAEFDALIDPLIARSLEKCRKALGDADLAKDQIDEVVLVGGSTRVPLVRQRVQEFFKRKPHVELNPDEVVAIGAAVQADILTGGRKQMLLLDVVPLSLGIETMGGVVDKIIHRNTTVPARARARYSTSADNQTGIVLSIYQGEREMAKDCKLLGKFTLSGIPPMAAGLPQLDVTFLVNENGMLTVSAQENRSGQSAQVTVKAAYGLSSDQIDRLVLESAEHAGVDFRERRLVEFRLKGAADQRHTEKALGQAGDQLSQGDRVAIEAALAELKAALGTDDLPRLEAAVTTLGQVTRPLAEQVMNSVVKQTLTGKTEAEVEQQKI